MGAAFEIRTDATNHVNQKFDTLGQPVSYKSHAEIIYFLFFFLFISLLVQQGTHLLYEGHRTTSNRRLERGCGFHLSNPQKLCFRAGICVWNNVPYKCSFPPQRGNCREIDDRLFYALRKWTMSGHLLSLLFFCFYFFSFKFRSFGRK